MSLVSIKENEIRVLDVTELTLVGGGDFGGFDESIGWDGDSPGWYDSDAVKGFCSGVVTPIVGFGMAAAATRVPFLKGKLGSVITAGVGGAVSEKVCPAVAKAGQKAVNTLFGHHHHHHHHHH